MSREHIPYFVYGTLRTGCGNWDWALQGRTDETILSVLPDYDMYAPPNAGFPAIASSDKPMGESAGVVGELVYVPDDLYDDVTHDLDRLEGWHPDNPASSLYLKVARNVAYVNADGRTAKQRAWVYEMGSSLKARWAHPENLVESGDWLVHQEDMYALHGSRYGDSPARARLASAALVSAQASHRCSRPAVSRGGAPCRTPVARSGAACADHR